jgi:DNA helicase-2/ATP-dependent DNA helicase PcrA
MLLSSIVPTVIFGDPMQGIFEFVDTRISWSANVAGSFPPAYELQEPHRWAKTNKELGLWISQVRQKLMNGQAIDLREGPINLIQSDSAFDMSLFFDGIDGRPGSTAAIHCWRTTCNDLAKCTKGAFQSIEEIAAQRLIDFAEEWDNNVNDPQLRCNALRSLASDAMTQATVDPQHGHDQGLDVALQVAWATLARSGLATDAFEVLKLERGHPLSRTYRGELMADARRAIGELVAGRQDSMVAASEAVRHRLSIAGRTPVARTISTPLLLKGLEFDHVLIPDATHYVNQKYAAAKLFYVAISRARYSLTISSKNPILQFPLPNL